MSEVSRPTGATTGMPARAGGTAPALEGTTAWTGWVVFAGIMMVVLGTFHIIDGLVALFQDEYFLVTRNGLTIHADFTVWGWVHMIGGLIVLAAGVALFAGKTWARVIGVMVAVVSAVINIGFLAAYPIWSTIMIALDVIVIWALTVHGAEMRDDY